MRFSIFLICLLSVLNTQAQSEHEHETRVAEIIRQQVSNGRCEASLKTTTNGQQLQYAVVEYVDDEGFAFVRDSMVYKWSANREMPHYQNPDDILFDLNYRAFEAHQPEHLFKTSRYHTMQEDSVFFYYLGTTLSSIRSCQYDALNRTISFEDQFINTNSNTGLIHNLSYNNTGSIDTVSQYAYNSSAFELSGFIYSTYDSNGWLVRDSIREYIYFERLKVFEYIRDVAGRDSIVHYYYQDPDTMSAFQYDRSIFYRYNATGLVSRITDSGANGMMYIDTFSYSGGNVYPASRVNYVYNIVVANPLPYRIFDIQKNSNGDVAQLTKLWYNYDTNVWDTLQAIKYYYNASKNPDSIAQHNSAWVTNLPPKVLTRFVYNQQSSGIEHNLAARVALQLYPNPAGKNIVLSTPNFKPGIANLYDMQGRLVMTSGIVKSEQSIDITRLPTGMYLVQYSGGDGSVGTARFVKE